MREDYKIRRDKRRIAGSIIESSCSSQDLEKRNAEKAAQKKFQDDSLKEIVTENFIYQVKKRITNQHTLDEIIVLLGDEESNMYKEVLEEVIKRTDRTVKIKDNGTQRKIKNGERGRLINPRKNSLEKSVIRLFNNIVSGLSAKKGDIVIADTRMNVDVENR